ncbi:MAG: hypothetical protein L6R38_006852 [Xanthoria sp. 2 TBL-2021]|nr:MAG: hypothetical protein L6R38_006852 [Xanthoria sp. 2 TBL-2021]
MRTTAKFCSSSQYADLERFTRLAVGDKLLYNYHVPGSPITVHFIIDTTHPIERPAMGRTIFTEQKTLRKRLEDQGNAWLSVEDDPYEFDDSKTGKCMIGMKSIHVGGDDGARLTYKGVLDTLQALWDVLYFKHRTYEAAFQVENGTHLVANGKVAVGNVPSIVQLSASKGNGVSQ